MIIRFQSSIILCIANKLKAVEVITVLKASPLLKTHTTPVFKFFFCITYSSTFPSLISKSITVAENWKKLQYTLKFWKVTVSFHERADCRAALAKNQPDCDMKSMRF